MATPALYSTQTLGYDIYMVVQSQSLLLTYPDGGQFEKIRVRSLILRGAAYSCGCESRHGKSLRHAAWMAGGDGNVTFTDPKGKQTAYIYDPLNRVSQMIDAVNGLTQFGYDPNGNLLSITDAKNHTTAYTYDTMDRLATRTDPLSRPESYSYDGNGNLISFTDRKGQKTAFIYDNQNRRIQSAYADGSQTKFSYDSVGNIQTVSDTASGAISYAYDPLNRLIQETTPQGVMTYTYDSIGRRISMSLDGQAPLAYSYDANSRLTTLMALTQTYTLTYDPTGRRTALSYPNGVTTSYSYDADSRITNILHQAGISTIENIGYAYDQNGNRTSMIRTNGSSTNLPQALQAAYDAANEQIQVNSASANLTYDANGNLNSDGTNTYTWNARNQLTAISGSVTASFSYDALGRRVSKSILTPNTSPLTVSYQYDGNDIVAEIGGGAIGASYVRSRKIDEPFARITGNGTEYYHTDALGSVFALTNVSGVTTASYTYDPFGNTAQTGISSNPFQYTGRENDGTGLYYYRARYYSPSLQRFISEDPFVCERKSGRDLYAYVGNNPIRFVDSLGLEKRSDPLPLFPFEGPLVFATGGPPCNLNQCLGACAEGGEALLAFCNGLPHPGLRSGCYALIYAGEVACRGWCFWNCTPH